jgi:hypothetical protein
VAEHTFQCAVNDRSTPLSVRCYDQGKDNNIAGLTVKFAMDELDGTNKLAATATGVTVQPGQTFTADSTSGVNKFTCAGHGLLNDWEVVVSNSGGALPTPLSATTRYFVRDATPNTFRLCTEPQAAAVVLTGNGTGTQTIKAYGHVQYAWTAADVNTAKSYKAWFIITDASGFDRTFPNTAEGIGIEIVTAN